MYISIFFQFILFEYLDYQDNNNRWDQRILNPKNQTFKKIINSSASTSQTSTPTAKSPSSNPNQLILYHLHHHLNNQNISC